MERLMFKDLKDLKCGDQVIMKDPVMEKDTAYALMSTLSGKDYYFVTSYGASLVIKDQETIDAFNVRLIDKTHPIWDSPLAEHGKHLGMLMDTLKDLT